MSIRCPRIFSAVSRMNFKSAIIFFKKVENFLFLYCIRIDDFSWVMNNKRIIEFDFHRISQLLRPKSRQTSKASNLGLNNSEHPAQPATLLQSMNKADQDHFYKAASQGRSARLPVI